LYKCTLRFSYCYAATASVDLLLLWYNSQILADSFEKELWYIVLSTPNFHHLQSYWPIGSIICTEVSIKETFHFIVGILMKMCLGLHCSSKLMLSLDKHLCIIKNTIFFYHLTNLNITDIGTNVKFDSSVVAWRRTHWDMLTRMEQVLGSYSADSPQICYLYITKGKNIIHPYFSMLHGKYAIYYLIIIRIDCDEIYLTLWYFTLVMILDIMISKIYTGTYSDLLNIMTQFIDAKPEIQYSIFQVLH
jgi:hypothetical protein